MILALYIKKAGKLQFQMAVSQVMPNWAQLLQRRRNALEERGCVVREKYYTEGEWARQMPTSTPYALTYEPFGAKPGRSAWGELKSMAKDLDEAKAVAVSWFSMDGIQRRAAMAFCKKATPDLHARAKRIMQDL